MSRFSVGRMVRRGATGLFMLAAVLCAAFAQEASTPAVMRPEGKRPPVPLLAPVSPPPAQLGWPVDLNGDSFGIAVGDIDYDGDMEVVVTSFAYPDATAFAFHHDGTPVAGWPVPLPAPPSTGTQAMTVAMADVDGNGTLEIYLTRCEQVWGFYYDGTVIPGWPQTTQGLAATPTIGDLDNDGLYEIAVGTASGACGGPWTTGLFYLFDSYGNIKPGWPVLTPKSGTPSIRAATVSPGAFYDIDNDEIQEILFSSFGGPDVLLYRLNGTLLWWRNASKYGNFDTAAVGDIDGDGKLEVVIGFQDAQIFAFNGEDGSNAAGWPITVSSSVQGPVSLLNAPGDSDKEILISCVSTNQTTYIFQGDSSIYPGWPQGAQDGFGVVRGTPTVGDLNGDGLPDVTTNAYTSFWNRILAWDTGGNLLPDFPFENVNLGFDQPLWIGDLNLDGDVEIGTAAQWSNFGGGADLFFWDLPYPFDPMANEWPQYARNNQHTNVYEPPSAYIPRVDSLSSTAWKTCAPPVLEVKGAYFESKPFVRFVPDADMAAFLAGDLSKAFPAASVLMDLAPPRKGVRLLVTPPELAPGTYEIVVQNPTGIRNVWPKPNSPVAPLVSVSGGCLPTVGLPPFKPHYPTDLDCDGCVDDLIDFSYSFGSISSDTWYDCMSDFNADGAVNAADLFLFTQDFGKGCFN